MVNKIKPEKNIYDYSLENYAKIDNTLQSAQMAIGQSSNLAQIALTYTYNFEDKKYYEYACILAVLAQVSIDNSKRKYDVDLNNEIARINKDLDIDKNGLPLFWKVTKKDKRKARSDEERRNRNRATRKKIEAKINPNLICPMNYLCKDVKFIEVHSKEVLPLKDFFINHSKRNENQRTSKKVEQLIQKYSLELYLSKKSENWEEDSDIYLLQSDYENLIEEIRNVRLSNGYLSLMSWLLNRGLNITSGINSKHKANEVNTTLNTNQALLTKILYDVNPSLFLQCFREKQKVE